MKFSKIINSIGAAILLLAASLMIQARPGDLDKTFGTSGIAANAISGLTPTYLGNTALQSDGKIVLVGSGIYTGGSFEPFVARYNTDGTLDASFGTNGVTILHFILQPGASDDTSFNAVAIQPDGKIIVGGISTTNIIGFYYSDAVVARFNTNGTLDTNFGTNGKVYTQTGTAPSGFYAYGNMRIYSLQIAPDGSFYATGGGGDRSIPGSGVTVRPAMIIKFASNGSVISAVYPNFAPTDNGKFFPTSALQPDGKLVVGLIGGGYGGAAVINDFVLMRYNADLSADSTFGTNGTVVTDFGTGTEQANGIVLDPDGKITVSGGNATSNDTGNFYAARYNPNGSLDTTFGTGGKVVVLISDAPVNADKEGQRIVRQPDGKYISAFGARYGIIGAIRLLPNGALDPTFGYGGIAHYQANNGSYPYPNIDGQGGLILLQPDGKIILSVTDGNAVNGFNGIKMLRLTNYARNDRADFEDDGKTDVSVVRAFPDALTWYYLQSSNNQFSGVTFGSPGDKIVSADFDGDGKTDVAVFRPSNGVWYLLQSKRGFTGIAFGQAGDIPSPADFDGDGRADICVFRPSNGTWYYLRSSDGGFRAAQFGANGDVPVRGDFDRDGKADFAVFRPSNGTWYILNSADNSFRAVQFGTNGDVPISADFDGDAGADIAVFRPSNGSWYYLRSSDGAFVGAQFGANGDVPVAGDYDGDGKADFAVFRNGIWYVLRSLNNSFTGIAFGTSTDAPIPAALLP